VDAPEGRKILAAVLRPQGTGPFPVVVVLHGTDGFRRIHVQLAEEFADSGFIGVAGSWFGGHYAGRQPPTPTTHPDDIDWPNGPDIKAGNSFLAANDVMALVSAARTLHDARADRVGVFGHSRGSAAALTTVSTGADVQAVVAVAGYPPAITVNKLQAPVLILQGTEDNVVPVQTARRFEDALRSLGKSVEAEYYEGAPHGIPWILPWRGDVRQRAVVFLTKHLVP